MNYFETIESIKEKLVKLNKHGFANEILEMQLSGGTGGEVLISVCSKLLTIKKKDRCVYRVIQNETTALISYANSIGLYPTASKD